MDASLVSIFCKSRLLFGFIYNLFEHYWLFDINYKQKTWYIRSIRDTQKDGATRCILGRSTYRPKIYNVCMGSWWQIPFFKMNSEQYMNSKVKILGKRLYSPNLRDVPVLESVQSRFKFSYIFLQVNGGIYRQMYEKLRTRLHVF